MMDSLGPAKPCTCSFGCTNPFYGAVGGNTICISCALGKHKEQS